MTGWQVLGQQLANGLTIGALYALIALGCAIRGETDHYTYIAQGMTHGIMDVMLKYDKPIGFGVILVDSRKLALARSGAKINYGAGAAQAALAILHNKE